MAIRTEQILKSCDFEPSYNCPKCHRPTVRREALEHDGMALYDLKEWCTMCGWTESFENVRF